MRSEKLIEFADVGVPNCADISMMGLKRHVIMCEGRRVVEANKIHGGEMKQ